MNGEDCRCPGCGVCPAAAKKRAPEVAELKLRAEAAERELKTIRAELAGAQAQAAAAIRERDAARAFKKYVHDRLDAAGVPVDPNPMGTKKHGCRIEGRLDALLSAQPAEWPAHFERLADAHEALAARDAEVTKLREAVVLAEHAMPSGLDGSIYDNANKAMKAALAATGNETKEVES